jgi:hypothetical protein
MASVLTMGQNRDLDMHTQNTRQKRTRNKWETNHAAESTPICPQLINLLDVKQKPSRNSIYSLKIDEFICVEFLYHALQPY